MKERILSILKDLMSMRSTTYSEKENEPAEYFGQFFRKLPYFDLHPAYTGMYEIPGDPYGRKIPYSFLEGKTKDTVVLSGHFDVVSTEEYGDAEPWAYELGEELEKRLEAMNLDREAREDLESGEWLWGRGSCDMKGGLAIHAALFERYAEQALDGTLEGSIMFMLVPDEESYSAGMRRGVALLAEFKQKYGLNYKLLIDPEPTALEDGKQVMSIGSVGKCMPAVLVQGKKGHAGHFFEGFSALSLITSVFQKINGSADFCDVYQGEMTMPPTWFKLRDMKNVYDVSIPHRAEGYFTVFSLNSTPEEILRKVRKICRESFDEEVAKLNALYRKFGSASGAGSECGACEISYEPAVVSFAELKQRLICERGSEFETFYDELYSAVTDKVRCGEMNYPDATLYVMEKVLDFSAIKTPLILLGFAPPYYAPVHSDLTCGKENRGSEAFKFVKELSEKRFGRPVAKENYFMGISDLSYSAVTSPFDYSSYVQNTCLWGTGYSVDFEAIEYVAVPSVIYGPIGREYHQYTERVSKASLLDEVPEITQRLIEYIWKV